MKADQESNSRGLRKARDDQEKNLIASRLRQTSLENDFNSYKKQLDQYHEELAEKRRQSQTLKSLRQDHDLAHQQFERSKDSLAQYQLSYGDKLKTLKEQRDEVTRRLQTIDRELSSEQTLLKDLNAHRREVDAIANEEKRLREDRAQIDTEVNIFSRKYADILQGRDFASRSSVDLSRVHEDLSREASEVNRDFTSISNENQNLQQDIKTTEKLVSEEEKSTSSLQRRIGVLTKKERLVQHAVNKINDLLTDPVFLPFGLQTMKADLEGKSVNDLIDLTQKMTACTSNFKVAVEVQDKVRKNFEAKRSELGGDYCPCCQQKMGAGASETYLKSLKELVDSKLPTEASSLTELRREIEAIHTDLLELAPDLTELHLIKQQVLTSQSKLEDFKRRLLDLNNQFDGMTTKVADATSARDIFDRGLKELFDLSQRMETTEGREDDLKSKKRRLTQSMAVSSSILTFNDTSASAASAGSRSVEEVEKSCDEKSIQKDNLYKDREAMRTQEETIQSELQKLVRLSQEHEKAYNELKSKLDRYGNVEAAIAAVDEKIRDAEENSSRLKSEMTETKRQVVDDEKQLQQYKLALGEAEGKFQQQLSLLQNNINAVVKWKRDIEILEASCRDDLTTLQHQREELMKDIKKKEKSIGEKLSEKELIDIDLNSQGRLKRNIEGNISLRQLKQELVQIKQYLLDLQVQSGVDGQKFNDVKREVQRCEQERFAFSFHRHII